MALRGEVVSEHDGHVQFVKGKLGTDLPVIDGFIFYQKDATNTRFYCRTRTCRATMKLVAGPDGTLRADRTPTHDHPNHTEYIATLRHIQRLREAAVNTHNKHVPSVKVCSAVRLETKTTRRRSVDSGLVRRCWKRGNAPGTPNEIETFHFIEKTRYMSTTTGRSSSLAATGAFASRQRCGGSAWMGHSGQHQRHTTNSSRSTRSVPTGHRSQSSTPS